MILGASAVSGGGGSEPAAANQTNQTSQSSDTGTGEAASDKQAEPAKKSEPELTSGQDNALRAAENYLDTMPFSRQGLIRQLSSPAGSDFARADAVFAVNHVKADWNAEAVEAARNYLDVMPMSRNGLIQQLSSSAGSQFTHEQAVYAADKVL